MIRCDLLIGGYSYRVTDDVMNWDDVVMSMKRADYDGVVRSFTSKFEFVNVAHALLKKQYRDKYLGAGASVVFYTRNNSWLWNERFKCTLDFSTFEDDGNVISISAVDDGLAALIKAKKGTQYEYSMDVVKEGKMLYYDRIDIDNSIKYIIAGDKADDEGNAILNYKYSNVIGNIIKAKLEYTGTPEVLDRMGFEYYDIPERRGWNNMFFITNEKNVICRLNSNISIKAYNSVGVKSVSIAIRKIDESGFARMFSNNILISPGNEYSDIQLIGNSEIKKGEGLNMVITVNPTSPNSSNHSVDISIKVGERVDLSFYAQGSPVNIDVVSPSKLLNRLLQSINGGNPGITGEIAKGVDARLDNCLIVAAESARGLPKAKLYTSYTKFVNWMGAEFGFVPVVGNDKVSFVHRSFLFQKKTVKSIGANCNSFQYNVNSSLVYSRVRVGYEKKDYEGVNGRDEFRFTNEYTTGVNLTDHSMELISPYRADAYGIEFLVQKRGEDTTDSDSDNDVFFVGAKISANGDRYELIREGYSVSGVISPDTMFNAMYSPRFMIEANKGFIGTGVSNLTFASSDGNSDVAINGISESGDMILGVGDRLFTVGEVSIESSDTTPPADLTGTVEFERDGEVYQGYIKDAKFNYGRSEAVKYTLIVESVK